MKRGGKEVRVRGGSFVAVAAGDAEGIEAERGRVMEVRGVYEETVGGAKKSFMVGRRMYRMADTGADPQLASLPLSACVSVP